MRDGYLREERASLHPGTFVSRHLRAANPKPNGTCVAARGRALLDTSGAAADVHAPRARQPRRPCRGLVGWCSAAGVCGWHPSAAVREAARLQAQHRPGLPHGLLRAAGVRRRDGAETHQPGSRGRPPQSYHTPQLHTAAARCGTQPFSYAPWPHPVASPPQLPQPHPYPCRSATATSSPPCSPRTRSASHAPSRRVAPPPSEPTSPAARPEIPRHACWPRSEAQAPPELPRSPRSIRAPWRRRRLQLPTLVAVPERASAPAALQRHLGQRHPLASRRRARGPLHLRLGPIQPREWKGGCTRSLRARMPREHGSLVRHTPQLQPQASKQGPRQLCHSHA